MKLIAVRHGESTHNVSNTVQGHTDTELTSHGERQARLLGGVLDSRFTVDAVYSSDLKRASRTAELLGVGTPETDPRLRELDFGDVTGGSLSDFIDANPEYDTTDPDALRRRFPNGESTADVHNRVTGALADIAERHESTDTVVVVAHFTPIVLGLTFVRGERLAESRQYTVSNCDGFIAEYDGETWSCLDWPAFSVDGS